MAKTYKLLTASALLVVGTIACATPRPVPAPAPMQSGAAEGMEMWSQNHPEASRELGEWVKRHPNAARLFFDWDGHHHDRAKHFVTWTIRHPRQNLDDFALEHNDRWDYLDQIMASHRPAANEFMAWCRQHHAAAEALMNHPGGLEWAGHHLYQDAWMMKHS